MCVKFIYTGTLVSAGVHGKSKLQETRVADNKITLVYHLITNVTFFSMVELGSV